MVKKSILVISGALLALPCYAKDITITCLYNNVPYDRKLETRWGLAFYIQGLEKDILFDTGGEGKVLLANMARLKIDPEDIDIVVLSHIHGDHVGGLWSVLETNDKISVYLPESFPGSFKNKTSKMCKEVVSVHKPVEIFQGVWSTGELGTWMKEQSLMIDTKEGLVVITGCAHPGIVNIVKFARSHFKKDVYLVLGGFHLMVYSKSQVKEIIKNLKELEVKKVGPSHCTGGSPIELFRESWDKNFINLGCGAKIKVHF